MPGCEINRNACVDQEGAFDIMMGICHNVEKKQRPSLSGTCMNLINIMKVPANDLNYRHSMFINVILTKQEYHCTEMI